MTNESRQQKTVLDDGELATRHDDVDALLTGIVGRYENYLNEPSNRLDFVASMDGDDFLGLARHINARLRGETPNILRKDESERGAFLPLLHTPRTENKKAAFSRGFDAIQEYITTSSDNMDEKLQKIGIASEALIVLVHPFNDGNGRTSRFFGRFLETGTTDKALLKAEAASGGERRTAYDHVLVRTKESLLATANNEDIISLDDEDRAKLRLQAETAPDEVEGMYVGIRRLLNSEDIQNKVFRYRAKQVEIVNA